MSAGRGAALTVAALLLAAAPVSADCLQDVRQTVERMDPPPGSSAAPARQASQANQPTESWQGGTHTQDGMAGSAGLPQQSGDRPAYNEEAANLLDTAAQLAMNGITGGCRQLVVQAQRILGTIPADTPLPDVR